MACRPSPKSDAALAEVKKRFPAAKVSLVAVDVASFESIDAFAARLASERTYIDILINNAGVIAHTYALHPVHGLETNQQLNFLGPARVTEALLSLLQASKAQNPRVVTVSSLSVLFHGSEDKEDPEAILRPAPESEVAGYVPMVEYGRSKLFVSEYMRWRQKTYDEKEASVSSAGDDRRQRILFTTVHPGMIATDIHRGSRFMNGLITVTRPLIGGLAIKSEAQGAACQVFAALCDDEAFVERCGGGFLMDCKGPCFIPGCFSDDGHNAKVGAVATRCWKCRRGRQGFELNRSEPHCSVFSFVHS